MVRASELAELLGVTRARVSQWVAEGRLDGCYFGTGRLRRFDAEQCARALGKALDPGQMLGNGAKTKTALRKLVDELPARKRFQFATELEQDEGEQARYEVARTQKAEEEARRLRRQNLEAEGQYVLAVEVQRTRDVMINEERRQLRSVIAEGARQVAEKLGADREKTETILLSAWQTSLGGRMTVDDREAGQAPALHP